MAAIKGSVKKNCVSCGSSFLAGSGAAKFCSDFCNLQFNTKKTDGCWIWTGSKDKDGYGVAKFSGGRRVKAHRAAYEISKGSVPKETMVCHSCDRPSCVNPKHLFLGTALDNKTDCVSKWRHTHGEGVHTAKLQEDEVSAILKDGRHRRVIADAYGVTPEAIDAIRKRKSWKHLGGMR